MKGIKIAEYVLFLVIVMFLGSLLWEGLHPTPEPRLAPMVIITPSGDAWAEGFPKGDVQLAPIVITPHLKPDGPSGSHLLELLPPGTYTIDGNGTLIPMPPP
ncbi:MAG: hypothetical protein WC451_06440 [Patescibacteria group bacterium]